MKQPFGLVRRPWGVFYPKNRLIGTQISLQMCEPVEVRRRAHAEVAKEASGVRAEASD